MQYLFAGTLLVYLVTALYSIFIKRRVLGLNLFVILGIYLPMWLWQLNWSRHVDTAINNNFYLIFIYLNIALIIYNFTVADKVRIDASLFPDARSARVGALHAMNIGYVLLFFFESYLGSGSIVPAFVNIDIHTYSAPLIAFITRNLFVFVIVDIVAYFVTKKKSFIAWVIVLLAIPVVTRSMRISVLMTLVQVATFVILVLWSRRKSKTALSVKGKLAISGGVLFSIAAVVAMAMLTNARMRYVGNNGPYEGYIAYTGPQFGAEVLSVYYGYFPLSFNNLNLTLKTGIQAHDFWGLYSFRGFYFGFCQLDNLLGLDADAPSALRVYSTGAATVNTGFYEYFYDYGVFCFIPIAAMIAICWYLTKRMQKSPSLFLATQYCCFVPLVFFESFQNVFFGDIMLWEVIFMYILLRLLFKREDTETERKIREKLASVCSKLPFLKSKRHEVSSSNAVEM